MGGDRMGKSIKKELKIKCMVDFEKTFYPKVFSEKNFEAIDNPKLLGARLAERSLKKIRFQLAKID
jgi:hypothetical protein